MSRRTIARRGAIEGLRALSRRSRSVRPNPASKGAGVRIFENHFRTRFCSPSASARPCNSLLGAPSFAVMRTLLIAALGEELTVDERRHFTSVTGRDHEPRDPVDELWIVAGRVESRASRQKWGFERNPGLSRTRLAPVRKPCVENTKSEVGEWRCSLFEHPETFSLSLC